MSRAVRVACFAALTLALASALASTATRDAAAEPVVLAWSTTPDVSGTCARETRDAVAEARRWVAAGAADVVLGVVVRAPAPPGAAIDSASFSLLANAFGRDSASRSSGSPSGAWAFVARELAVSHGAVVPGAVPRGAVRGGDASAESGTGAGTGAADDDVVLVDGMDKVGATLAERVRSGRRGVVLARVERLDVAKQHEDAVALDAWLRKVWEPAADAARESKAKLAAFLASELELGGAEAEVGAERWRRELQSSANKYRTGNVTNQYVTMVPELFTGLILILSTVLTLIMFFCCCLAEIEAPTAWAKQYPAKGKEFN